MRVTSFCHGFEPLSRPSSPTVRNAPHYVLM